MELIVVMQTLYTVYYCIVHCRSLQNVEECSLLLELVNLLLRKRVPPRRIGVITPYKAQERRIRRKLKEKYVIISLDFAGFVALE